MEHRTDLEDILLSGLPAAERDHVLRVIGITRDAKLAHLRAVGARDVQREAREVAALRRPTSRTRTITSWTRSGPSPRAAAGGRLRGEHARLVASAKAAPKMPLVSQLVDRGAPW